MSSKNYFLKKFRLFTGFSLSWLIKLDLTVFLSILGSIHITLQKVQKILLYALKSENTFQSFNMEVYGNIFF